MRSLLPGPKKHVLQLLVLLSRSLTATCHSIGRLHTGHALYGYQSASKIHDCYSLLGVDETADDAELKAAYLSQAKEYHPDSALRDSDPNKFNQLQEAYRTVKAYRIDMETRMTGALAQSAEEDDEDDRFNIKHKAPQHRQYLSNDGVGYGTPAQRQKQYQQYKVWRAEDTVAQRRISIIQSQYEDALLIKDKKATRRRTVKGGIERIVEDLIQESMAKGEFDNLTGSGKPLTSSQDANPMVDSLTFNLNKIIINEGFAPQWVVMSKEIRADMEKARTALQHARIRSGPEPLSIAAKQCWASATAAFTATTAEVNKKVDRLNMVAPTMQQQQFRLDARQEVKNMYNWYSQRVAAGHTPQLPDTDMQDTHKSNVQFPSNKKITAKDVWQNIKGLFSSS